MSSEFETSRLLITTDLMVDIADQVLSGDIDDIKVEAAFADPTISKMVNFIEDAEKYWIWIGGVSGEGNALRTETAFLKELADDPYGHTAQRCAKHVKNRWFFDQQTNYELMYAVFRKERLDGWEPWRDHPLSIGKRYE